MAYHVITRDGVLIGVTTSNAYSFNLPNVSIHEFEDDIPDLNTNTWNPEIEEFEQSIGILSRREFLMRFTLSERISIRASIDPVVLDIMNMLDLASFVNLSDVSTQQSVGYLAQVGLIQPARITEILG